MGDTPGIGEHKMSEIKRYRKKPVVIEAVQWDGTSGGASTVID